MTATTEARPWDFSHVLDLVNSLSYLPESPEVGLHSNHEQHGSNEPQLKSHDSHANGTAQTDLNDELHGLGDFSKLWRYLGSPPASPDATLAVQTPQSYEQHLVRLEDFAKYESDSAVPSHVSHRNKPHSKQKQESTASWQDQSSAEDQAADTVSDGSAVPDTPTLTKSQRKKKNRREKRLREAHYAEAHATKLNVASVSESEAKSASRKPPAKTAVLRIIDTPQTQRKLRHRDESGRAICAAGPGDDGSGTATSDAVGSAKVTGSNVAVPQKSGFSPSHPDQSSVQGRSTPLSLPLKNGVVSEHVESHSQPHLGQTASIHTSGNACKFHPSTIPPVAHSANTAENTQRHILAKFPPAAPKHAKTIEPMVVRSGEDRHWALLIKLLGDFYEDRKHLISPMNLTTHNNDRKGIHVFVDASNIFIGFNDQLKRSRGIPWHVQVPPVNLSFDALALLMERRRPVAKRVLVGSTPQLPAFDKAKAVGYECNILEKVYKARELTERQVYFRDLDRANQLRKRAKAPPANNVATLTGRSGSGSGSGSETNTPQYAPARMIEQGVDEILHLKILESIVDSDAPSTIVLATGDAAQAEYSEGFMAMAERALKKGWKVELVSWSKNISAMYTRREWVQAWGERFRIVTLDDYAEELLDM